MPAGLEGEAGDGCFAHPAPADYGPAVPAADRATGGPPYPPVAIPGTDRALWARVIRHARCTGSSLNPDQWFPISVEVDRARREAAAAITVCTTCLVRAECLALSLRHWDIGQHGVWGGLVAAERAALPRRRHATVPRTSPDRYGQAVQPPGSPGPEHPQAC